MDDVSIDRRAARVKLLLMDCDGVLTDGRIWLVDREQQKAFNVRDGLGLNLLHECGIKSGVISGLNSSALARRAEALGMSYVRQGNPDKIAAFEEILSDAKVEASDVAFVGDDLTDLPLMRRVGFSIAVADAVAEAKAAAHFITEARGGNGAVREVIEIILKAQGRWSEIVSRYMK
jgi:3-deoxy-D-manno-octulosonate 8-phosphate phosphatase (KDO 8-P phosphatase)